MEDWLNFRKKKPKILSDHDVKCLIVIFRLRGLDLLNLY